LVDRDSGGGVAGVSARGEYLGFVYRIVLFYDHRGRPM